MSPAPAGQPLFGYETQVPSPVPNLLAVPVVGALVARHLEGEVAKTLLEVLGLRLNRVLGLRHAAIIAPLPDCLLGAALREPRSAPELRLQLGDRPSKLTPGPALPVGRPVRRRAADVSPRHDSSLLEVSAFSLFEEVGKDAKHELLGLSSRGAARVVGRG